MIEIYSNMKPKGEGNGSMNEQSLGAMLKLESCLRANVRNQPVWGGGEKQAVSKETLNRLAEDFVAGSFPPRSTAGETYWGDEQAEWRMIISDEALFSYFQDMVSYVATQDIKPLETPAHLRKIVQEKLASTQEEGQSIWIQLKDSLKLLTGHVDGLLEIPVLESSIATRASMGSDASAELPQDEILQFYKREKDGQNIVFQITKDSPQTITLSVSLPQLKVDSVSASLERNERLVQSYSSNTGRFYFRGLGTGKYQIRLRNQDGKLNKRVCLKILED